jgi:hypothetical protein
MANAAAWARLFDRVHVISLPSAADRRARLRDYLPAHGITDYEIVDALGPGSPEVEAAYASGMVQAFPPCFRCGKTDCGEDDCNNVLIPPQVGNVLSHLSVWRRIAASGGRGLVLEDDVVFHPWTGEVLDWLAGQDGWRADVPRLMRMGWALGDDHVAGPPRMVEMVRMSNPAHAMTAAFAQKLVAGFSRITTTSDLYLHRRAPGPGEAVTVLPPIASELSWSVGAVPSSIHPHEAHAEYLEAAGRAAEAAAFRKVVESHVYHMYWRPLLVLGLPGGGLEAVAALMRGWGLDVGAEADGRDGICSWAMAAEGAVPWPAGKGPRDRRVLRWGNLVQVVQEPHAAMAGIMAADRAGTEAAAWRRNAVLRHAGVDLGAIGDAVDRAAMTLIHWTRMIEGMGPDVRIRAEDGAALADFLRERGLVGAAAATPGPQVAVSGRIDAKALSVEARVGLRDYCARYGFDAGWLDG